MGNGLQKEPQGGKTVRAVLSSATKKSDQSSQPAIVSVAGGTGSSRTTVVTEILNGLDTSHMVVLQHDSYYKDRGHLAGK
jgi:uridine kinase